jgi:hypothetical protein
MGTWHYDGREDIHTSCCRFLRQESHTRDITRTLSAETARLIGSQESFSRAQIAATERGFAGVTDAIARQVNGLGGWYQVPEGFAFIPPGCFRMGSPDSEPDRGSDEGPQREVTITRPFFLGSHPVTQRERCAVMGTDPSSHKGADLPVENVSWHDALAYCTALSEKLGRRPAYTLGECPTWHRSADGARLSTEAEWEYACRAGSTEARHSPLDWIA